MGIYIKFYAKIKEEVGTDAMHLHLKGKFRLIDLLKEIDKKVNKKSIEEYYTKKRLLISVNDALVNLREDILLKDGDKIDIMPLPSGG